MRPPARPSHVEVYYAGSAGWCTVALVYRRGRSHFSDAIAIGGGQEMPDALQEAARGLRQRLWSEGNDGACDIPVCAAVKVERADLEGIRCGSYGPRPGRLGRSDAGAIAGTLGALARTGQLAE